MESVTGEPRQIVTGETSGAVSEYDGRERPAPRRQVEAECQADVAVCESGRERRRDGRMHGLSGAAARERKQAARCRESQPVFLSPHLFQHRDYIISSLG